MMLTNKRHTLCLSALLASCLAIALLSAAPTLPAQSASQAARVDRVAEIGMVVSDLERSVDFYSRVLTFEKISDVEVYGAGYEHLEGLFGLRMRVVRMKLGEEILEFTEFLGPQGRPIPVDSGKRLAFGSTVPQCQGLLAGSITPRCNSVKTSFCWSGRTNPRRLQHKNNRKLFRPQASRRVLVLEASAPPCSNPGVWFVFVVHEV